MPCQFVANVISGLAVPSLIRAKANRMPVDFACAQSTMPWYFDTSIPWTVVPAGQVRSGADWSQDLSVGDDEQPIPQAIDAALVTRATPKAKGRRFMWFFSSSPSAVFLHAARERVARVADEQ
jgi:hypothetical protein